MNFKLFNLKYFTPKWDDDDYPELSPEELEEAFDRWVELMC